MKRYLLILTCFLSISYFVNGQVKYYVKDGKWTVGKTLLDKGEMANAQFCHLELEADISKELEYDGETYPVGKKEKEIVSIKFTPQEVSEYGLEDGRVYEAREIQVLGSNKMVFLERLEKGKVSLFYYIDENGIRYFLENDEKGLVELFKKQNGEKNYRKQLMNYTSDCPQIADKVEVVAFSRDYLALLIERYNNCESGYFPFLKFGLTGGVESFKMVSPPENEYLNNFDFQYHRGFSIGLFLDRPIEASNFSLHGELRFFKNEFTDKDQVVVNEVVEVGDEKTMATVQKNLELSAHLAGVKFPFLVRYSKTWKKVRPFANAGIILAYNFKNDISLYELSTSESGFERIDVSKQSFSFGNASGKFLDDAQMGLAFGGGVEIPLNYKRSFFVDFRYQDLYKLSLDGARNGSGFLFSASVNF